MALPIVVLKPRRAEPFFGGHPWVFSGAIAAVDGDPSAGDEVLLVTDREDPIGRGLFNPHGNITVRLYNRDPDQPLDDAFWTRRLEAAVSLRRDLLDYCQPGSGCRIVFSEADGLSGLIVDQYGEWLLLQWTSFALSQRGELLVSRLQSLLQPRGIWLRTEKGVRDLEGLEIRDGLIAGEPPPRPILVTEHGIEYAVDVVEGQKTGLFLDQRENRLAVAKYTRGRRMLDVCCYAGGFSLNALKHGGATAAVCIDSSESALTVARNNAERNGVADRCRFERGDAFKTLERLRDAGETFGVVVLDPPKLTRSHGGVTEALRGYHSLNKLGVSVLEQGGILVTCSCSGHVSGELFSEMLGSVAASTGRGIRILERRGAAPDHPVSVQCPETEYLKCFLCRVD
jgi:23S rRNA (cytosine1962-C5)-methyltransferase